MKDLLGIDESEDPSIWRQTNEPAMLAMCARMLAKTTTPGYYPQDNMAREAVEAAQKLYKAPEALLPPRILLSQSGTHFYSTGDWPWS